ncbi:23S rRNA (uracil-5-)-methyltransferase RumA [Oscillatoriales cyanobacterium USR001]|nr:23S rRNA (uracil-5-)-methyltransferase RumA [Oscillatoriales cyanobacterium USR001]
MSSSESAIAQAGQLVDLEITDLADSGDGVGRLGQLVVFVPDTVPGDRAQIRLIQVKSDSAIGTLHHLTAPSEHRIRPSCIVADKCGGCQWQHISWRYQLTAKQNIVTQALQRIGGFTLPPVDPVLTSPDLKTLGYRNKATYPLATSSTGQIQAGYYQKGSHRLINLNQCPVQDDRLNPLLKNIKQDIQQRGWKTYDEKQQTGELRHLSLRIGRRTGEILLTLVARSGNLPGIEEQAAKWLQLYPQIVGVCLNINPRNTNVIFGSKTHCILGQPYLREIFSGLEFQLRADTFFQVNSEAAETLLQIIAEELNLMGNEVLIDAYCGIGTFTLPLARLVDKAIGLEVQEAAVEQAQLNAALNYLTNVSFYGGAVEMLLPELDIQPDVVLLDPPRKGCDREVLTSLVELQPSRIAYISCKPSTLARDLKFLCQNGGYQLTRVQPADFFPQTPHVECVAFLVR